MHKNEHIVNNVARPSDILNHDILLLRLPQHGTARCGNPNTLDTCLFYTYILHHGFHHAVLELYFFRLMLAVRFSSFGLRKRPVTRFFHRLQA